MKRIGLDIGSTTVKYAIADEAGNLLRTDYRRHRSRVAETLSAMLTEIAAAYPDERMILALSGSAGMGLAESLHIPFVQEVYATRTAVRHLLPGTDAVIELGGEDAKILFLSGGLEVRMNGSCAGGTGAFIDQMAQLMQISPSDMDVLAQKQEKIYTIASRCGVFAKSDIQPLLNQGARKEDISASIFHAVVNQTVVGLAQGRPITGNIVYLGGPLTFFPQLRRAFDETLKVKGVLPENSLYFVALGALYGLPTDEKNADRNAVILPAALARDIGARFSAGTYRACEPLFRDRAEYDAFRDRHAGDSRGIRELDKPADEMFLGIDAGSTTVKAVLCDREGNLFRPSYQPNNGNPVPLIRDYLRALYRDYPDIRIVSSAVTGYGEDIIRAAFHVDRGVVETIAHFTAAEKFRPDVDFIIDIGGQDIKCFRIRNHAIDNIFLNEACSSGCGSFLQAFAGALGYTVMDFAKAGLLADRPVDLGSRCTVFMNSSVKQAQKDGASVENISAGLSISVVKNALYKVIRCANPDALGRHIVVQGGTFLNDAVLRAFEKEIGKEVIRPHIAGLMGAYGAALYAMQKCGVQKKSTLSDAAALENFRHEVRATTCRGCSNHCRLTVNTFDSGRRYIAGNRCERPLQAGKKTEHFDLFAYKERLLASYRKNIRQPDKKTVGLPMGLNFYDLLPFWHAFFTSLGYNVLVSPPSSHNLYRQGISTIPSDTVCYPAKLMHGHIDWLISQAPDYIFYPSMTYNVDEGLGDNHYNCPVVAYYPKVIDANVKNFGNIPLISDFIGIHDKKAFRVHMSEILRRHFAPVTNSDLRRASDTAYAAYERYKAALRIEADRYIAIAKERHLPVIVLAGRPYHIDPEVNHGIDRLLCDLGAVVLTEDSVSWREEKFRTTVLNQWAYHSRLYAAAKYVTTQPNMQLVQLVSFGCGVDAITSDEVRTILESAGKLYTQIKIDEITNLGAVRIRLRSLFAVMNDRD